MTRNGKRRPPRPAIELIAPSASPEQAAAIAAALERFLHDTTPVITPRRAGLAPWARAAIAEGVGLQAPSPWGDPEPWGGSAG
jgi:hypothetical protein